MSLLTWIGIIFCISQSAMFSGMNLALFSISRLRLEVEADLGNRDAVKILNLRKDSNFLLTTVLWGNVGINVLLTLLSNSALAGVSAFFFSTVVITIIGEIMPQAYFSRHALRTASMLAPVLKFYQILLYPAAKPTAKILDAWLGAEGIQYYWEHNLREVIKKHIEADESDVDRLEGIGALNFLAIDDLLA
ncbi:MAG: CNNM domain-containing protein, partial [Desulfobacterales bacterium]